MPTKGPMSVADTVRFDSANHEMALQKAREAAGMEEEGKEESKGNS